MDNAFIEKIKEVVGEKYVKENESMASHCTFRCGGNAELFVTPGSIDELTQVVALCRENNVEFLVIGNGSNLLVKDEGYKGVIIEVNSRISFVDVIGEDIVADAGAKLSAVAVTAMENDLGGFEFAHGIPGNIGGAVMMNAGAYGGEMKQVLKWVKVPLLHLMHLSLKWDTEQALLRRKVILFFRQELVLTLNSQRILV